MSSLLRRIAAARSRRPLLRTAVRGGLLRLQPDALIYGEGWLGSRQPRRISLDTIAAVRITPDPTDTRGVRLRIAAADESWEFTGVSPLAARRMARLIAALRGRPVET